MDEESPADYNEMAMDRKATVITVVSHSQTLFCTEGKGLRHGHGATCHSGMLLVMQIQS